MRTFPRGRMSLSLTLFACLMLYAEVENFLAISHNESPLTTRYRCAAVAGLVRSAVERAITQRQMALRFLLSNTTHPFRAYCPSVLGADKSPNRKHPRMRKGVSPRIETLGWRLVLSALSAGVMTGDFTRLVGLKRSTSTPLAIIPKDAAFVNPILVVGLLVSLDRHGT